MLLAPPLAVCAFLSVRRWFSGWQTFALVSCVAVVTAVLVLVVLRVSSTVPAINLYVIAVAYAAYCFVGASCWRITRPLLRRIAIGVALLPAAWGYLLGTIGVFALALTVGDYMRSPEHVEQYRPGLTCRITSWGWIPSSGQTVHLYRSWVLLPFLEREVVRVVINDADPNAQHSLSSCSQVLAGHVS